ncbi:MAG: hypothetical protein ACLVAW_19940 [Eisenbergiella massiliensis]
MARRRKAFISGLYVERGHFLAEAVKAARTTDCGVTIVYFLIARVAAYFSARAKNSV